MKPEEEESHWDSLADELGLEPAPAPPTPKPAAEVKPRPAPEPEPLPAEESTPSAEHETEPEQEAEPEELLAYSEESPFSESDEEVIAETNDTVLDEEGLAEVDGAEIDGPEEGDGKEGGEGKEEGKGRRRRRRRRKKKGGGDPAVAGIIPDIENAGPTPVTVARAPEEEEIELAPRGSAELLDDAPEELPDDGVERPELPTAMDEELTEENAQPAVEWKVVSWTDLVGSLYRPER